MLRDAQDKYEVVDALTMRAIEIGKRVMDRNNPSDWVAR